MSSGLTLSGRLARMEWLVLLTGLAIVILFYPLKVDPQVLTRLHFLLDDDSASGWSKWLQNQLGPFLNFLYSPLIIKAVLAAYALLGFIILHTVRFLLAPQTLSNQTASIAKPFFGGPRLWLNVILFFGWAAISVCWSVTPVLSKQGAYFGAIYGGAFWVMLRRGFDFRELRTMAWLFVLLGIAALAFLIAQRTPWLLGRIAPTAFDDVRNKMGTLLGHNTAAASFLMLTGFMAFALLLISDSAWRRTVLWLYLIAVIFSILMLQSRSIWFLAPLLGLLAGRHALRVSGKQQWRHLPTFVLAVIALGLLSQAIDMPWNPFFVRDNPLQRRLHAVSLQGLQDESRLRLNIIGLRLVPGAPMVGYGLYAFQYVYPKAQGEYFLRHPDSRLHRPLKYSNMVHNEYLQIWIELGTVGLTLCIWMLVCLARAGRRRRAELGLNSRECVLHAAFGWGALGFLLHSAFDFPFHIAPLGLSGLICMAGWAAPRKVSVAQQTAPATYVEEGVRLSTQLRPLIVLRLTGAFLLIGVLPFLAMPLTKIAVADVLGNEGGAYLKAATDPARQNSTQIQMQYLSTAMNKLRASLKYDPDSPFTKNSLAEVCTDLALMYYRAAVDQKLSADQRQASANNASRYNYYALKFLNQAAKGLDYYLSIHYMRARIYYQKSRIPGLTSQSVENDLRMYREALETTLRYAPNFPQAAYDLTEFLTRDKQPDVKRIAWLRQQIYRFDSGFFERSYANPATNLMNERRYAAAARRWDEILGAISDTEIELAEFPRRGDWIVAAAQSNLMLADVDKAKNLLALGRNHNPAGFNRAGGGLLLAGLAQDWIGASLELNMINGDTPEQNAGLRALEAHTDARLGRVNFPTRYPLPEGFDEHEWRRLQAEALPQWLMYFQDWEGARQAFEARLAITPSPDAKFWALGLYIARALNDPALQQRVFDELRRLNPNDELVKGWLRTD